MELLFGFGTLASLDITFLTLYNLVEGLEVNRPDRTGWRHHVHPIAEGVVYLAVLMDVFARCIRGWHLGRSLKQELTITALRRPIEGDSRRSTIPTRGCSMRRRPTSRC